MRTSEQLDRAAKAVVVLLRQFGAKCEQLPDATTENPNWYKISYRLVSYLLYPHELKDGMFAFFCKGGIPTLDEVIQIAKLTSPLVAEYLLTDEGYQMFVGNYNFHYENWKEYWDDI